MKKMLSTTLMVSVACVTITFLFGCAEWNQARVEQKYGPPARKEIVGDKTVYCYYYSGRSAFTYRPYTTCLDITFDKGGKLIGKREYSGEHCNAQQIDSWLTLSGGDPPTINVTGKWHDAQGSGFFGWDEGYLWQEQNKIRGTIGGYDVKGAVSGKRVYLVFLSGGAVYYRARLEMMSQDLLLGSFFRGNDDTNGSSMSLEKMVGPTK